MEFANVALTVILSLIALAVFILRAVRSTMRDILVDEGLIRPGRRSEDTHWPNGWHNLPDTLEGIYRIVSDTHELPGEPK